MKNKSYISFIASMLVFGTIGIFRRYIPLTSGLLAALRGFMGAAFITLYVKLRGGTLRHGIGRRNFLLTVLSGGLIGFNWILLFEAYNYTSVSVATLCYYMEPTIVILLSPVFLGEKLTGKKLLCALIAVIGMALVAGLADGEGATQGEIKGVLFGLGAAAFYSAVVILNKKIVIEDAYEKTAIQLFSAAVILLPYLALTGELTFTRLDTLPLIMLIIVGVVHTGICYTLYFGSMKNLSAQSVALLSYIDPVSAMLLSALILHESMSVWGVIGAVMIIGAAIVSDTGN